MYDRLLSDYLAQLPTSNRSTERLFVIGMIGLPGSGKSTLAKQIAEKLDIFMTSSDAIRRYLYDQNVTERDIPEYVYAMTREVNLYLLRNDISYVLDGDLIRGYRNAYAEAEQSGASMILIHVNCTDAEARRRITARLDAVRSGADDTLSRATIEEYEVRKRLHAELGEPDCDATFDTERAIEPQINRFCEWMRETGYVV